jgi:hypothetical protein
MRYCLNIVPGQYLQVVLFTSREIGLDTNIPLPAAQTVFSRNIAYNLPRAAVNLVSDETSSAVSRLPVE